jgi:hypothetical protein
VESTGAELRHAVTRIRPSALVAALAAGVFVVLLFVANGQPERPKPVIGHPQLTTGAALRALSATTGQPVYWLGEQPGTRLELTRTVTGRVFVRYLPETAQIGDQSLTYPFVATYRHPNALAAVRSAARANGSVARRLAGGGLAVQGRRGHDLVRATLRPLPSPPVFFAYPGSDYLVEVYDSSGERALSLVTSRRVQTVR